MDFVEEVKGSFSKAKCKNLKSYKLKYIFCSSKH